MTQTGYCANISVAAAVGVSLLLGIYSRIRDACTEFREANPDDTRSHAPV